MMAFKRAGNAQFKKKNYLDALNAYEEGILKYEVNQEIQKRLTNLTSQSLNLQQQQKQQYDNQKQKSTDSFGQQNNKINSNFKNNNNNCDELFKIYVSLITNKALCEINLKCFRNALESVNQVLKIDENNIKALYRRAQAQKEIGVEYLEDFRKMQNNKIYSKERLEIQIGEVIFYLENSLNDYYKVKQQEPNNNTVIQDLSFINKNLPYLKKEYMRLINRSLILKKQSSLNEQLMNECKQNWHSNYLDQLFQQEEDIQENLMNEDVCPYCQNLEKSSHSLKDIDQQDLQDQQVKGQQQQKNETKILQETVDNKQNVQNSVQDQKSSVKQEQNTESSKKSSKKSKKSKKGKESSQSSSSSEKENMREKNTVEELKKNQAINNNENEITAVEKQNEKQQKESQQFQGQRSKDVNQKGSELKGYYTDLKYMKFNFKLEENEVTYNSQLTENKLRNQLHHQYKIQSNKSSSKGKTSCNYSKQNKRKMSAVVTQTSRPKAPFLPAIPEGLQETKKYTLVLDLDKTLIYSQRLEFLKNNDRYVTYLRPNLYTFLDHVKKYYELVIFTAAEQDYADKIIDYFDPEHKYFEKDKILYKQHVKFTTNKDKETGEEYKEQFKDLKMIGRDLSRTLIIDDIEQNFALQKKNGIKIPAYEGGREDNALLLLIPVLQFFVNYNLTIEEASQIRLFNPVFKKD
ncbi:HAD-like domain [Pseudocohnilembus persalinus]|uniref:HAD-like domain n=1 Tax=Pseudocohnilembus persalinus TaxID=266149 RepID=A0A0V0R220_PSEPJ|nr:HAD-like domain [Pseudocohnilembus persalinus]|eukprot:KRX08539.1 HAD-like domain [Pseudocohnilembus persalinus]